MKWRAGKLTSADIHSKLGLPLSLRYRDRKAGLQTRADQLYHLGPELTT